LKRLPEQAKEPAPFRKAREDGDKLSEDLETRTPVVTVVVKGGSNAKLTVDDIPVPNAAIGLPLRINPGHHTIGANTPTARGEADVDIAEGEKKDVTIALVQKPLADSAPPPETSETHPKKGGSYAPAIIPFSVAGAGAIVGGITGVMTLSKQSDLASACPNKICGPSNHGDIDSANTLGLVSTISFIAAGVCAATGVVLIFVGKPKREASVSFVPGAIFGTF